MIAGDDTPSPRNRLADKHARRRAERARNKKQRLADQEAKRRDDAQFYRDNPPPF